MDPEFELNLLILKFLRNGVCPEAAQIFEETLNRHTDAIPKRLDWKGTEHRQTVSELEKQFPRISDNHLLDLCQRVEKRSLLSLARPPLRETKLFSPVQYLKRSQLGFKATNQQTVYSSTYKKIHLLRRTVGHLSAVFCILFDKTGLFVFTGADDLLVKMWGTHTGRLYFTFRGASAEISDMAISEDNRLLAAGSTDKIIRVWCLTSAAPIAVLAKHTGNITALHFCPATISGVPPYLAATSGDGTVSFWRYTFKPEKHKRPLFDPEPTRYHEKMRPGGAQMICASFSPGGLFMATGSADHHVRVYMMDGKEGPVKVLEQEAHTERVDSLQWANQPSLRFASGSKDGTARIWRYEAGEWHSSQLVIKGEDGRSVRYNQDRQCEEPLRVTMTTWTADDTMVVTAVSDASLCVWDSKTCRVLYRLKGHTDEVYVLEPHPSYPDIIMSGAHDGSIIIWQISTNSVLFKYQNQINGQGHGAIYDAKWSPDHLHVAASDSHGHVLFFGTGSSKPYEKCPEEMFFHSDYRPLLRDAAHHVVDEQSQCAPHLLPPPILVDIEGNPYPADIQRLVPGRENLSDQECLVPNMPVTDHQPAVVNQRTTDQSAAVRIDQPVVNHRRRSGEGVRAEAASVVNGPVVPASNIDQLIAELAANTARDERREVDASREEGNPISEHSYASPPPAPASRGSSTSARERQRSGVVIAAPASRMLARSIWRKRDLVSPNLFSWHRSDHKIRRELGHQERIYYKIELGKKKHKEARIEHRHQGIEQIIGRRRGGGTRGGRQTNRSNRRPTQVSRRARQAAAATEEEEGGGSTQPDSEDEQQEEEDVEFQNTETVSETSLSESDLESDDSSSGSSTEYSDWGANNLTPPQRTARKSERAAVSSKPASSDDDENEAGTSQADTSANNSYMLLTSKPGPSRIAKSTKKNYGFNTNQLDDIPPEYLPSDWLAQYVPNKSPYFPQMGDEVMYIKQGHIGYINLVKNRESYRLNMREQQWLHREDIKDIELVKVIGMKYEIRPPRLCCLKLAIMGTDSHSLTGENFSIKYHDMNDVVDFLVLKHSYEASMKVGWKPGDRYRCQIEDAWWYGSVLEVSPYDPATPNSPFLSIKCFWDSGEEERLSPWDLDPVLDGDTGLNVPRANGDEPESAGYEKTDVAVPVTREEIERFLYQPLDEEWRGLSSKPECKRISAGLEQVMALAIAEPFNYPVDLTLYPDYMLEIEYPMDFSLVKSRLDNQFYRRVTAIQFDVRYLATNTECYNRPKTDIVKNARILTDLVLKIIQDPGMTDIMGEYHRLVDNFKWEDTKEHKSSNKGSKPGRPAADRRKSLSESPVNPKQWKHDCNTLIDAMFKLNDSEPFREAVSEIDFPDYTRIITTPMDLSLIRESLSVGEYTTPNELKDDIEMMFANSLRYNTDRKSAVVKMTKRLKLWFKDNFHTVVTDWRKMSRRVSSLKRRGTTTPTSTPKKSVKNRRQRRYRDEDEDDDESDPEEGPSRPSQRRRNRPVKYDEGETSQEETSDEEERPRRVGRKPARFREDSAEPDTPSKGRRRNLALDISDTSDIEPKSKGKGVGKGKGVSSKALSRNRIQSPRKSTGSTREEEFPSSQEAEVEHSTSRNPPKKDWKGGKKSSRISKPQPPESQSEEDKPISARRGDTGRGCREKSRKSGRTEESDEDFLEEEEEELTEETEETEHTEDTPDTSEDENEESDYEVRPRKKSAKKKSKKNRRGGPEMESTPRPRRQATARAMSRFNKTDSEAEDWLVDDDEEGSGSRRRRGGRSRNVESTRRNRGAVEPDRRRRRKPVQPQETVTISAADSSTDPKRGAYPADSVEDEEEEGPLYNILEEVYPPSGSSSSGRRKKGQPKRSIEHQGDRQQRQDKGERQRQDQQEERQHGDDRPRKRSRRAHIDEHEDITEPPKSKRRTGRPDYSEDGQEFDNAAASVPTSRKRKRKSGYREKEEIEEEEETGGWEETSHAGEPENRGRPPARLADYTNDELIREATRKVARARKKARKQARREEIGLASVELAEEPIPGGSKSGERGLGRRERKQVRYEEEAAETERPGRRKSAGLATERSSERRRGTTTAEPNYVDQTESEHEEDRIPYRKTPRYSLQNSQNNTEDSEEEEEEKVVGTGRTGKRGGQRTVNTEESSAGRIEEEEESEESDYGKRKRPRRSLNTSSRSGRPQRSSTGQPGRSRYRESSDEDLHPKRHHRLKMNRRQNQGESSEEEEEEEQQQEEPVGVSSRGRIRRPNPRLLD